MTRSEYLKLRLEHTLQHTQQSTRLIYLVNGAVLAMLYFVVKLEGFPFKRGTMILILIVLAFVNLMHALLIKRQGIWYAVLDKALAESVETKRIEISDGFLPRLGTHTIYASLHAFIALALFVAAIILWQIPGWP